MSTQSRRSEAPRASLRGGASATTGGAAMTISSMPATPVVAPRPRAPASEDLGGLLSGSSLGRRPEAEASTEQIRQPRPKVPARYPPAAPR
jgi:hypothetical protein